MIKQKGRLRFPRPTTFFLPEVRERSEVIWNDGVSGGALRVLLVLLAFQVGLILWWWRQLPPEVPLYYGRPWGATQLAQTTALWLLPVSTLGVGLLNGFLGGLLYSRDKLAARMLLLVAALVSALSAFSLSRILLLVL